jgi:hypothetical protein
MEHPPPAEDGEGENMSGTKEKIYPHKWGKHVNWSDLEGEHGKIVISNGLVAFLLDDNRLIVVEDNIDPSMPIPMTPQDRGR